MTSDDSVGTSVGMSTTSLLYVKGAQLSEVPFVWSRSASQGMHG